MATLKFRDLDSTISLTKEKIPSQYILAPFSNKWQTLVHNYVNYCAAGASGQLVTGGLTNIGVYSASSTYTFYSLDGSPNLYSYYANYSLIPDCVFHMDITSIKDYYLESVLSTQHLYKLKDTIDIDNITTDSIISDYFEEITNDNANSYSNIFVLKTLLPVPYVKDNDTYPRTILECQIYASDARLSSDVGDIAIQGFQLQNHETTVDVNLFSCLHRCKINQNVHYIVKYFRYLQSIKEFNPIFIVHSKYESTELLTRLFKSPKALKVGYSKELIRSFNNELGFPWTFSVDEALNVPTNELTDYNPEVEGITDIGDSTDFDISADATNGLLSPGKLTNFFMVYNPSDAELRQIAAKFWSQNILDTDQILKIISNPSDAVICFRRVPYTPSSNQSIEDPYYFTYGPGIQFNECPTAVVQKQYEVFDYGNLDIPIKFQNFMDYSPFTKYQLYLPFVGFIPILPEDWIGCYIRVRYIIDNISGAFIVQLIRNNDVKNNVNQVMSIFSGKLGAELPVTSFDYGNVLSTVASVVSATAGAGFSAFSAISKAAGNASSSYQSAKQDLFESDVSSRTGNESKGISEKYSQMKSLEKNKISYPMAQAASTAASKIGSLLNMNVDIARSGGISSELSQLNYLEPYLIITRINPDIPSNYNSLFGKPCNEYLQLGSLSGFTVVDSIHLDGISCTETERNMIDKFLKSGVII